MSKAKFTSGPWVIDKDYCWIDSSWGIRMGDHHCAATVVAKMDGDNEGSAKTLELEANAHLIAAAPDMYHALDELIEMFTDAAHHSSAGWEYSDADKFKKLLAKARGEV